MERGEYSAAIDAFRKVAELDPSSVEAEYNLAAASILMGEYLFALERIDRAYRLLPENSRILGLRGVILKRLGRIAEAEVSLQQAVDLDPVNADSLCNLATVKKGAREFDAALKLFDESLLHSPLHVESFINRGNLWVECDNPLVAEKSFARAIQLDSSRADAWSNFASVAKSTGEIDVAAERSYRACQLDERHVDAHWNLGLYQLQLGQWDQGWPLYEWRLSRSPELQGAHLACPRWDGVSDLTGKRVLLTTEQGLGDSIQFFRFALVFAQRFDCAVGVQAPLVRLFSQMAVAPIPISDHARSDEFDFHFPLMSLPLAFGLTPDDIPYAHQPYIRSLESNSDHWSQILGVPRRPRIGVMWSGGDNPKIRNRSIPLSLFSMLLGEEFDWVSLQKDLRADDASLSARMSSLRHYGPQQADFADAAGIIDNCDLVISVDTSIAHLAGAMGKECWVLLPKIADWRWMLNRDDSPWYSSVRLFRQASEGDWLGLLMRVRAELLGRFF